MQTSEVRKDNTFVAAVAYLTANGVRLLVTVTRFLHAALLEIDIAKI
jgi:hypothetical protein